VLFNVLFLAKKVLHYNSITYRFGEILFGEIRFGENRFGESLFGESRFGEKFKFLFRLIKLFLIHSYY
jgi:hypothetical protein